MSRFLFFTGAVAFVLTAGLLVAQSKGGKGKGKGPAGDVAKGKEVFEQCAVCHNADSEEKKMGPGLKGLFKKATLADGKTKATEAEILKKINQGGNGMPAYEEMLSREERANLIAYLKTL